MADRTFGWVQDPGSFDRLRRVVEIFDPSSATHRELVEDAIPRLVTDVDVRQRLLDALATRPLRLSYTDLAGRALGGPRAHDPCNGIVQAALSGQRRAFISDWAAENFVRWAHALCFLSYDRATDTFAVTESGCAYVDLNATEKDIEAVLHNGLLTYPPVVRVLRLLKEKGHLTKFEIGRELGFVGEGGFTSLNQDMVVREVYLEPDAAATRRVMNELEGSSDKYARTVAGWLEKAGWVRRTPKTVLANGEGLYALEIAQSYTITKAGLDALRRADGSGRHPRIARHVSFEMLATKAPSRDYLRARRAELLRLLAGRYVKVPALLRSLAEAGYPSSPATVEADLRGLRNLGLRVLSDARGAWTVRDEVRGLEVPRFAVEESRPNDLAQLKEDIRARLRHVPHDYLALIDLSFDGSQNRVFEFQTMALFELMGFHGRHLGGSDRPDGVFYTEGLERDYGLIIDTKAYSAGFGCDRGPRDQMKRYVDENRDRPSPHPTSWWNAFPTRLKAPDDFRFLFVSSRFTGRYEEQLQRLGHGQNGTRGAAISASSLLLFAEAVLARRISLDAGFQMFGALNEVVMPLEPLPEPGDKLRERPSPYQPALPFEWA